MKDYALAELDNGIRLIHKQTTNTKIAHIGLMLDIGSRDERPEEQGIAHFWEHMAFKGTKNRASHHIINRLDNLGGELNAYTTKEKICFYAAVLDDHVEKAIELLIDIVFNSTFPVREIDKERKVILEEMAMYRDTPEDAIQDELEELVFPNHPIGANILGTEATVSGFKQADFHNFLQQNLNTTRIVISSVGKLPFAKINRLVRKHLSDVPHKNHTQKRDPFHGYRPIVKFHEKPISQAHLAFGTTSFNLHDPRRIPFFMLTNILGGPAMNSRLNMSLREKHGLVYNVELNYSPFTDGGLLGIYLATDQKNLRKAENLIAREVQQLKKVPLTTAQLAKAKAQLKGQLAMSEENNNAMMLMMAKSLIDMGTVQSLDHIFGQIDAITTTQLLELAQEGLNMDNMSKLTFLPNEHYPSYN